MRMVNIVSIPLKSGHISIKKYVADLISRKVSIPLKSGHISIRKFFNSNRNLWGRVSIPLKSGHISILIPEADIKVDKFQSP